MHYQLNFHKLKYPDLQKIPYPHPTQQTDSTQSLADSIKELQGYYPIYHKFFELNDTNYNQITFNHRYQIVDLNTVYDIQENRIINRDVFIKYSPLLDPIKYMVGKYDLKDPNLKELPKWSSTKKDCNFKLLNPLNASYIDTLFCVLSSILKNNMGFQHGIDFYGTFLGIQDKYCMNVEEDIDYLLNSSFFNQNLGKKFILENFDTSVLQNIASSSRKMKQKVQIEEFENVELDLGIVDISDTIQDVVPVHEMIDASQLILDVAGSGATGHRRDNVASSGATGHIVYEKCTSITDSENQVSENSSDTDSTNTDDFMEDESDEDAVEAEDADDEWETESEDETEENFQETLAYLFDYPVQLICMERCKGTFDSLLVQNIPVEECASALFQIIMILLTYQKVLMFTHNDLHTNNIMYVETEQPFLYYKYQDRLYKVPTYGRIYKIIDYGRAIYRFQKQIFCSDSFAPGGDASSQYNCEPFIKMTKPLLEPNPSFDLCRLGCSIYDFIFDSNSITKNEAMEKNELQRTIQRWCTDDNNRNVLYKKNGEERYPGFNLYKMIARTVHQHTPERQLDDPWFKQFLVNSEFSQGDPIMDIDSYNML